MPVPLQFATRTLATIGADPVTSTNDSSVVVSVTHAAVTPTTNNSSAACIVPNNDTVAAACIVPTVLILLRLILLFFLKVLLLLLLLLLIILLLLFLVGCLTSQQHASVSQGRICSDNCTCCHTEIEVADTFHLTQSQYTDTGLSSPSADPIAPGAWQGSHWSANFEVTGMTRPRKNPGASGI